MAEANEKIRIGHVVEREAANDNFERNREKHELREVASGGLMGKAQEAVRSAPQGAIILVGDFPDGEYVGSEAIYKGEPDVKVLSRSEWPAIEAVLSETRDNASITRDQKIVVNVPHLLRDTFFSGREEGGELVAHLMTPTDDPTTVLSEWLKKENESSKTDISSSPSARFLQIFERLQAFTYDTHRPMVLAMPANSPLALAFFAAILSEWRLDEEAVARAREHFSSGGSPIALLRIENGVASVSFGGDTVASRVLY